MAHTFDELDQDARVARAIRQDFTFVPQDEGTWICENEAGDGYLVTVDACTCEDCQYRTGPAGALCKHSIALRHHLLAHEPRPEPAKSWEGEAFDAMFRRIFG